MDKNHPWNCRLIKILRPKLELLVCGVSTLVSKFSGTLLHARANQVSACDRPPQFDYNVADKLQCFRSHTARDRETSVRQAKVHVYCDVFYSRRRLGSFDSFSTLNELTFLCGDDKDRLAEY